MLAVTDLAAEAIRNLTTDLPGGGLRISTPDTDPEGLELALADRPSAEDVVVGEEGSAVFLEPAAAGILDDKALDVQAAQAPDGGQELCFAVGTQALPGG